MYNGVNWVVSSKGKNGWGRGSKYNQNTIYENHKISTKNKR